MLRFRYLFLMVTGLWLLLGVSNVGIGNDKFNKNIPMGGNMRDGKGLSSGFVVSSWDHGAKEIKGKTSCPVLYPQTYKRERELLGYNPRFMPGIVNFDNKNRPVIRIGVHDKVGDHRTSYAAYKWVSKNYIQILKDGKWYMTDSHMKAVRKKLGLGIDDILEVQSGERVAERVVFDKGGDAYTMVLAKSKKGIHNFLLHSKDGMRFWDVYQIKAGACRLEDFVGHNLQDYPPVLLCRRHEGMVIFAPEKDKNGTLIIPEPVLLADRKSFKPGYGGHMAGCGTPCLSYGDKVFVVFIKGIPSKGQPGTHQYIVSYNRKTGKVSDPVFLGITGDAQDGHNKPCLAVDSKGYLHVIAGAHWHSFLYRKSLCPGNVNGWTKPEYIYGNHNTSWSADGLSYPGFVIGDDDTLHLVSRGRSKLIKYKDVYNKANDRRGESKWLEYSLVYLRKKANGLWEARKDLVMPLENKSYGNWYHKTTIDRKSRVFNVYYYYAAAFSMKKKKEYHKRWPREPYPAKPHDVKAHDPVIVMSDNNGYNWRIALTKDFEKGLK